MSSFRRLVALVLVLGGVALVPTSAQAATPPADPLAVDPVPGTAWVTDGSVYALARDDSALYLGGTFSYLGPNSGSGTRLDAVTGSVAGAVPFVEGPVSTAVSDGSGGFYIGGHLTAINGVAVTRLAHLRADGSFDESFKPAFDGNVRSLVRVGSTLYVAGEFANVAGQPRAHLAAFDVATGNLSAWAPAADGVVAEISEAAGALYLRGAFTHVNGAERHHLAAVALTDGATTSFSPFPTAYPDGREPGSSAFVATSSAVYVGGLHSLVAFDSKTGVPAAWNGTALGPALVEDLAVDDTNVYVAADDKLMAIPRTDGSKTAWLASTGNLPASTLALDGSRLVVGGLFKALAGGTRRSLGAVDARTGELLPWNPSAHGAPAAIAIGGGSVYIAGWAGGVARKNLAALSLSTGRATDWNPSADASVLSLARSGTTLFAGGHFTAVNGEPRYRLAAINTVTGATLPWRADASGAVRALTVRDSKLYVGGAFTQLGGTSRSRVAAVAVADAQVDSWAPVVDGEVAAIASDDLSLYIGGAFSSVNGQPRGRAAAFAPDGSLRYWNPSFQDSFTATSENPAGRAAVLSLLAVGSRIYAGGRFTSALGQSRRGLASFYAANGALAPWAGEPNGEVRALAHIGGDVIAGGDFSSLGRYAHRDLAAYDALSGEELDWTPTRNPATVWALSAEGTSLAVGAFEFTLGMVITRGLQRRTGVAFFDTSLPTNWSVAGVGGPAYPGATVTCDIGGPWSGSPKSYAYDWYLDDVVIAGESTSTYRVRSEDAGHDLRCRVTALNDAGHGRSLGVATRVAHEDPTPSSAPPPPVEGGGSGLGGLMDGVGGSPSGEPAAQPTPSAPASTAPAQVETAAPAPAPAPASVAVTLSGVTARKYPRKVVVKFVVDPTVEIELAIAAPGRSPVPVATRSGVTRAGTIVWNRKLNGRRARAGVRYALVLTAVAQGQSVTRTVYVRL